MYLCKSADCVGICLNHLNYAKQNEVLLDTRTFSLASSFWKWFFFWLHAVYDSHVISNVAAWVYFRKSQCLTVFFLYLFLYQFLYVFMHTSAAGFEVGYFLVVFNNLFISHVYWCTVIYHHQSTLLWSVWWDLTCVQCNVCTGTPV